MALVANYKFNHGALTIDTIGGVTLTNTNAVAEATGKFNGCADFGAIGEYRKFNTTNIYGLSVNGPASFSFWLKMKAEIASATYDMIFWYNDTSDVAFNVRYNYNAGTRRVEFIRDKVGIVQQSITTNSTLGTANWHHFVWTYDGTNVKGYLDGSYIGAVAASGNGSYALTQGFTIGANMASYIDDLRIYNSALAQADVDVLYANGELTQIKKIGGSLNTDWKKIATNYNGLTKKAINLSNIS